MPEQGAGHAGEVGALRSIKGPERELGSSQENEDERRWETEKSGHLSGQVRSYLEKKTKSFLPDIWGYLEGQKKFLAFGR